MYEYVCMYVNDSNNNSHDQYMSVYHGIVHYAGQAKPRGICQHSISLDNENRVQSYTPWVNMHVCMYVCMCNVSM